MSDPLEETISLSDMTEITETEGPRATQHTHTTTLNSQHYATSPAHDHPLAYTPSTLNQPLTHTVHALGPRNACSSILPKLNLAIPQPPGTRASQIMWLVLGGRAVLLSAPHICCHPAAKVCLRSQELDSA